MVEVQFTGVQIGGLGGCSDSFGQQSLDRHLIAVSPAEPDLREDVTLTNALECQLRLGWEIAGFDVARRNGSAVDPILTDVQDPCLAVSVHEVVAGRHGLVADSEFKRNGDAKIAWGGREYACARY